MHKKNIGMMHLLLVLVLIPAVIFLGLPQFLIEDLNRDREIDLADAIIGAKNFVQTADHPSSFSVNVKSAVSAIHLIAGLKTKISTDSGSNMVQNPDQIFLMPGKMSSAGFLIFIALTDVTATYRSIDPLPKIPPPRLSTGA